MAPLVLACGGLVVVGRREDIAAKAMFGGTDSFLAAKVARSFPTGRHRLRRSRVRPPCLRPEAPDRLAEPGRQPSRRSPSPHLPHRHDAAPGVTEHDRARGSRRRRTVTLSRCCRRSSSRRVAAFRVSAGS